MFSANNGAHIKTYQITKKALLSSLSNNTKRSCLLEIGFKYDCFLFVQPFLMTVYNIRKGQNRNLRPKFSIVQNDKSDNDNDLTKIIMIVMKVSAVVIKNVQGKV